MRFVPTGLAGACLVELEPIVDGRGQFARTFCSDEFERAGLPGSFVQCSLSRNDRAGTLRGMHYQDWPRPEAKLVRCVRGAAWDVLVDLRPQSPTYCTWIGVELSAANGLSIYVPPGVAHGFVTRQDDTDIFYQMTERYDPALARGVRWNDPAFGIDWPLAEPILSERDATLPDFRR